MTTYPTLKLVKGTATIDLNDRSSYYLRDDFVPPETVNQAQIATGSAVNRSGGRLVDRKPQMRSWSFSVRVVGSSDADIVAKVRVIKALLVQAGDVSEPVKLRYKSNSDTPEPLWGQFGAWVDYTVIDGGLTIGPDYMKGARRAKAIAVTFNLTIQPYVTGKQQRVLTASGGVQDDRIGSLTGRARGLLVPEATTNLHTNPVFGNATYDTNWTSGASLIKSKVTDKAFVPFGFAAVKLTATAAANNTFTESITLTVATYTLSYYVMLPDLSAVSSTQCQVVYDGAAQTTTFTQIEGGLYVAHCQVTGTAAAHTCGLVVKNTYTVIVCAGQCELKDYRTPLAHGAMLGHAWTGTAHASSSTRTVATCKITNDVNTLLAGGGTIRVVWRPDRASTGAWQSALGFLFDTRNGLSASMLAYYDATNDIFIFSIDGTVAAITSTQTFSAGDAIILHFTWGPSGIFIFKNGTQAGTNATFVVPTLYTYLHVGGFNNGLNYKCGGTLALETFGVQMTAQQVADDAANMLAALARGGTLEAMPWLWTKDGDDVVDNCNDSTRDNWCVVGGVDGDAAAETEYSLTASGFDASIDIGLNAVDDWVDPVSYSYADYSGTVDANSSGGAYQAATIDTSGLVPFTVLSIQDNPLRWAAFRDREWYPYLRVYDVGASLTNYRFRPYSSTGYVFDNNKTLAASWQMTRLNGFRAPSANDVLSPTTGENVNISMVPKRASGSADIRLDYIQLMPWPLVSISSPITMAAPTILLSGMNAIEYLPASSNRFVLPKCTTIGDPIDVLPNKLNTLVVNCGATITNTVTFNWIKIRPRWELV